MVTNIHARTIAGSAEAAGRLLDGLASSDDRFWPARGGAAKGWPAIRFDRPLGVGATGGHGMIRYSVDSYTPGRAVTFRFDPRIGLAGTHSFTVTPLVRGRVELRHVLTGRTVGVMRVVWPLLIRPMHDALLEDAFDNAERELTGSVAQPALWSRRVRLARRVVGFVRRRQLPGPGTPTMPAATRPVTAMTAAMTTTIPSLAAATFGTRHSRQVTASPEVVRQAIVDLKVSDLRLTRLLVTVRGLSTRRRRRSEPTEAARLVDAFAKRGFVQLADEPALVALGAVGQYWRLRPTMAKVGDADGFAAFDEPGWAKAVAAFTIDPTGNGQGSVLTTTTTVTPTDDTARRAFRRYWALIRVPSGLIRREMLAAIARRAEATTMTAPARPPHTNPAAR